ncbi:bifunctional 4-hydroxy-2-oxoglutarate aldolase/2-dehydro-3-deoxy-phosphogluconate aldolase [Microbacterium sp. NPDC058389]|uniref:bifunctional 4-hydroxy-2-oxoglutarate aldolase/2-dehydro-3-deoxy-phosphogluconate aldolase n=1 Tax=Microbacterium sp. NPDC058389 TaxID=3346475 RepID=UPI00364B093F
MNEQPIVPAPNIVPVIEIDDAAAAVPLVDALSAGGIRRVEVTLRTSAGLPTLARIAQDGRLAVGAGSVLTITDAQRAADAGAAFVVSPGYAEDVVQWCQATGMPVFPGIATPTEAQRALSDGLTTVKVFPVSLLGGTKFLAALRGPFPRLEFFPSGGIAVDNVSEYGHTPGVVAIGTGWVAPRDLIDRGEFDEIAARAARAVTAAHPGSPQL